MGPLQWIESHWLAAGSALATAAMAWVKRSTISSTASSFWRTVGGYRELRTALASSQAREEICRAENEIMRAALERLTGTALLLKQAKDQGLIRPSSDWPASPSASPTSSPSLPPATTEP